MNDNKPRRTIPPEMLHRIMAVEQHLEEEREPLTTNQRWLRASAIWAYIFVVFVACYFLFQCARGVL